MYLGNFIIFYGQFRMFLLETFALVRGPKPMTSLFSSPSLSLLSSSNLKLSTCSPRRRLNDFQISFPTLSILSLPCRFSHVALVHSRH
jgi:hypothetical protein